MRRSIHEIILNSFDLVEELCKLDMLFFQKQIFNNNSRNVPKVTMYSFINKHFHKLPNKGTCLDLFEYINKLRCEPGYYFGIQPGGNPREDLGGYNEEEKTEIAFGNTEFYLNMCRFVVKNFPIVEDDTIFNTPSDFGIFSMMNNVLNNIIDHIGAISKEIDDGMYIVIPNDDTVIATAELANKAETSKKILMYNHLKTRGDLETKKAILRHLYTDIEKKNPGKKRSQAHNDFDFIVNQSEIRHNAIERFGKSINENMTDAEFEDVCDVAYRLYLIVKLEDEYEKILENKVAEYKSIIKPKNEPSL